MRRTRSARGRGTDGAGVTDRRPFALQPASVVGVRRRSAVHHAVRPAAGVLPPAAASGRRPVGRGRRPAHDDVVAGADGARPGRAAVVGRGPLARAGSGRGEGRGRRRDGGRQAPRARGRARARVLGVPGLGVRPRARAARGVRRDGDPVARRLSPELVAVAAQSPRHDGPAVRARRRGARRPESARGLRGAPVGRHRRLSDAGGRGCSGAPPPVERGPGRVDRRTRDALRVELAHGLARPDDHAGRGHGGWATGAGLVVGVGPGPGGRQLPRRAVRAQRRLLRRAGVARRGAPGRAAAHRERPASLPPGPALAHVRDGRGRGGGRARGLRGGVRGDGDRAGARRPAVRRRVLRRDAPVGRRPGAQRAGVRGRRDGAAADRRRYRRQDRRGDPRPAAGLVRAAARADGRRPAAAVLRQLEAGVGARPHRRAAARARPLRPPRRGAAHHLRDGLGDALRVRPVRGRRRGPHPRAGRHRERQVVPPELPARAGPEVRPPRSRP